MAITLPSLPFDKNALEPHISANTLDLHHGKHHQAYVTNTNNFIEGTSLANKPLEEIIRLSYSDPEKTALFNNAAQVWNHTFYWHSLSPRGGGAPKGTLASMIERDFGGLDPFKEAFKKAAVSQFGSGWAWLILSNDKLEIMKTGNADLPMVHGKTALLTCDVWEHAYYLDYQNRRPDYVTTFLENLVNWEFAEHNLNSQKK